MSMLLKSYQNVPLPPEGSEEWLAMLPGWSGWIYNPNYGDTSGWQYRVDLSGNPVPMPSGASVGVVYWHIYEGKTGDVPFPDSCPKVGDTYYYKLGDYYYFRGVARDLLDDSGSSYRKRQWYEIARATSLTPQR